MSDARTGTWLESAAALLAEPDPGPTPMLVDDLIVDRAIGALQGAPKAGKTWLELELAVSIVTGEPALGVHEVPEPGPVLIVLEESGRAALHRRLGALLRGREIAPTQLIDLHFSANQRVLLDAPDWQQRLRDAVRATRPRAVFLDPLARLKSPGRDENEQTQMAPLLDFMRELRELGDCAVIFAHHTGHNGTHLRGTSDLESYWETKLTLTRDSQGGHQLDAAHREATALEQPIQYRQDWDPNKRAIRLIPDEPAAPKVAPVKAGTDAGHIAAWINQHDTPQASRVIVNAIKGLTAKDLQRRRPALERDHGITRGEIKGSRGVFYGTSQQWKTALGYDTTLDTGQWTSRCPPHGVHLNSPETQAEEGGHRTVDNEPVSTTETPTNTGQDGQWTLDTPYGGTESTSTQPTAAPEGDARAFGEPPAPDGENRRSR